MVKPNPDWVQALKPSGPQGTDLLKAERAKSNINVDKLSTFMFTKEVLERQSRILSILEAEKVFDKSANYFDGRVDKFQTALARAKRMRQLQVKHNWNRDEYMVANELISEPGPYGLHASMYLVNLAVSYTLRILISNRPLYAIKVHPNNTSSSLSQPRTTKQLDVTHRLNWDMAPMFEVSRLQLHGTRATRHSPCTRLI